MEHETNDHLDYHDAIRTMHEGNVVKYIGYNGSTKGFIPADIKTEWEMRRGVTFRRTGNTLIMEPLVYNLDYRFKNTGETVDVHEWPIKSKLDVKAYSFNDLISLGLISQGELDDYRRYRKAKQFIAENFRGMF